MTSDKREKKTVMFAQIRRHVIPLGDSFLTRCWTEMEWLPALLDSRSYWPSPNGTWPRNFMDHKLSTPSELPNSPGYENSRVGGADGASMTFLIRWRFADELSACTDRTTVNLILAHSRKKEFHCLSVIKRSGHVKEDTSIGSGERLRGRHRRFERGTLDTHRWVPSFILLLRSYRGVTRKDDARELGNTRYGRAPSLATLPSKSRRSSRRRAARVRNLARFVGLDVDDAVCDYQRAPCCTWESSANRILHVWQLSARDRCKQPRATDNHTTSASPSSMPTLPPPSSSSPLCRLVKPWPIRVLCTDIQSSYSARVSTRRLE